MHALSSMNAFANRTISDAVSNDCNTASAQLSYGLDGAHLNDDPSTSRHSRPVRPEVEFLWSF